MVTGVQAYWLNRQRRKKRRGGLDPRIEFTLETIYEDADVGDLWGYLTTDNTPADWGTSTYSIETDDDGVAQVDGDRLEVGGALDYDTATEHFVTVKDTPSGPYGPITRVLRLTLLNVLEVTLNALTIDDTSAVPGEAWDAEITGKTSGSTITATASDGTTLTVVGTTVSGTFASPSPEGAPFQVTLHETHPDAAPRDSVVGVTVAAVSGSAPGAYTVGQWTLADNAAGNSLTITITALPSLNGNTQTGTQYRINSGAWQTTALVGLGDIMIVDGTDLPNDLAADIEIRVLVAEYDWDVDGTGDEDGVSDTKTAMPTLVTAAAPDAFALGDWGVTPTDTAISVTITDLPYDGGSPITDIEYRLDGGTWTSSGGTASFSITSLTNGVEYDVELRAVNSNGASGPSDLKSAEPIAAAPTYQAESEAIFVAFTTPPDTTRKGHIDTCVASIKTAGVWAKLDGLCLLAAADSQAALINWKNPGTYNLAAVNSPTFTADEGYAGNGSNAYLGTGFVPSTAGGQMTQNSAHIGAYCRTNRTTDQNKYLMGCANGAYNRLLLIGPKQTGTPNDFAVNGSVVYPAGYTTSQGHHIVSRTAASGSGALKGFLNGNTTPMWTDPNTSAGLPDVAIRSLASCQDTSIVRPTTDQLAAMHWGAGLDATEQAALAAAINTYLTAIGANVY